MRPIILTAVLAAAAVLSACEKRTEPPGDVGVCYHVVPQKDGTLKYNKLVVAKSLETCAANLEAMRVKFLRMGGTNQNIYGAYQANFLFLDTTGVMTSTSLEGPRYPALTRMNGQLVLPTAMPQAPQR